MCRLYYGYSVKDALVWHRGEDKYSVLLIIHAQITHLVGYLCAIL
jgi:hypothetical protein